MHGHRYTNTDTATDTDTFLPRHGCRRSEFVKYVTNICNLVKVAVDIVVVVVVVIIPFPYAFSQFFLFFTLRSDIYNSIVLISFRKVLILWNKITKWSSIQLTACEN